MPSANKTLILFRYDDKRNPIKLGHGPSSCNGLITDYSHKYGGGVVHLVTRRLSMNAASKISAAGVLGGGGGSVWIQAKEVYSDFSAGNVVSVAGSAYPGIPGKFSPLRGVALFSSCFLSSFFVKYSYILLLVCGSGGRIAIYTASNSTVDLYLHNNAGPLLLSLSSPCHLSLARIASTFYSLTHPKTSVIFRARLPVHSLAL